MIVDDESMNLELLECQLNEYGLEPIVAANGREALDKARLDPPDLIVTDILMPVMDGYELCRQCQADPSLRQIPLIFYTGTYTDEESEEFAKSLGAKRFLHKPESKEILLKAITETLSEKEAARAGDQEAVPDSPRPLGEEMEFFRKYNEVLFRKLEKKVEDLKRAHRKLADSERRYRLTFESTSDVILMIDRELEILSISPSVEAILGYKPEECVGRLIYDLRHRISSPSLEEVLADMDQVLKGELPPRREFTYITRNGAIMVGEITYSPVIRDGEIIGITLIARDITGRRQAEDQLLASQRLLGDIISFLPDATLVIDREGVVIAWNRAMEVMTGVRAEDMLGRGNFGIRPALLRGKKADFDRSCAPSRTGYRSKIHGDPTTGRPPPGRLLHPESPRRRHSHVGDGFCPERLERGNHRRHRVHPGHHGKAKNGTGATGYSPEA